MPPFRSLSLLPFVLGSVLLAPAARADSDEYSAQLHLETSVLSAGDPATITLRSTEIGGLVWVFYSESPGFFVPGNHALPVLHLGLPVHTAGRGTIDSTGRFRLTATIALATPPGTSIYVQALVRSVAGHWTSSNAQRLIVDGGGTFFTDATNDLDPATGLYSAADADWADLDRNGYPDALVANDGTGALPLLLMGNGSSLVDEAADRLPSAALVPTSCIEAADVNGDGSIDLFLGGGEDTATPAPNRLLLNDGTGHFVLQTSFPAGSGRTVDAEFGDVDDDGDLDLVVGNVQDPDHLGEVPEPVVLYRNSGNGTFVKDAAFAALPGNAPFISDGDVSLGDVDNDGDLDLYVCRAASGGAQNQLYLNGRVAGFSEITATALPVMLDDSFEADFADFDGDGLLDVFVANNIATKSTAVHLLHNLGKVGPGGTPVFSDASANLPASLGQNTKVRISCDLADVEGDGDVDIVVGIHELPAGGGGLAGKTTLLLNQGGAQGGTQGLFAVDAGFDATMHFITADVSFADMDDDGDLDLYIANSGDLFQTAFQDVLLRNEL